MNQMATSRAQLKATLDGILRSPLKLRLAIGVTLLGAWYFALFAPAVERTATTVAQLDAERKRLDLAVQIEDMRLLTRRFQEHLPQSSDQNEFIQYLMGGIRRRPVKLVSLAPKTATELGQYKLISVVVAVEGSYANLEALVRWMESDTHLLRIEEIGLQLARTQAGPGHGGIYSLELTVIGIFG